jgi:hypothetical protein
MVEQVQTKKKKEFAGKKPWPISRFSPNIR